MTPLGAGRTTARLGADPAGIARAAALLRAGGLVAFPTETVYGLGADARNPAALAALYAAKGRPAFNPLILHLPDLAGAEALARFTAPARALARAFWPGPLTLVLPLRPGAGIAPAATAGLPTVALRVPDHPVAASLLAAFGGPVAAPSANPSGRLSPTRSADVAETLGGRIDAVIEGGDCPVGLESTILGLAGTAPVLLRPGGLPAETIEAVLGVPLARPAAEGGRPEAPGALASHYAPASALRLAATAPRPGEAWLGFGPDPAGVTGPARSLSARGDLAEAAAALYRELRALDAALGGRGTIAVAPVPETGLGRAINDRLRRAAAPRDAA